jgi:hypothetical protein
MKSKSFLLFLSLHIFLFFFAMHVAEKKNKIYLDKQRELLYIIKHDSTKSVRAVYFPDGKIFVHSKFLPIYP